MNLNNMNSHRLIFLIKECIREVIRESQVYIITGIVDKDLNVVGEKYTDSSKMVTHPELRSKYYINGEDWRYRNDVNTILWWGFPDNDEIDAVKMWLNKKFGVINPKSKRYTDGLSDKFHYTWKNEK